MSTETYTAAERVNKAVEVCKDRCSPLDCTEAIAELEESMEALKKRNEPIKPTLNENHCYVSDAFKCGKCGHTIKFHAKYCEECGQAVKWDG